MKKKIITIALIVSLVAVAAVGSNAYFTAAEKATNVITSGSVKIDLQGDGAARGSHRRA